MDLLQSGFERRVSVDPRTTCLRDGAAVWTYGELEQAANRVARRFSELGVGPDRLVVLHLERSPRLIALMLGVLKAGGGYVPVDPKMGRGGLADMLRGIDVAMVVSQSPPGDPAELADRTFGLDAFWASSTALATTPFACPAAADHLAYAIFTSGSAGRPRLVGVEHRNVCNLIDYACTELFDAEDLRLVPFIDSVSFDACVHQIFTTLAFGGTLLIERDLASLQRSPWIGSITALGGTPTVIRGLLESAALPPSVRVVSLGGEVIPEALMTRLGDAPGLNKAFNFYGPTETTIYSTVARLLDRSPAAGARPPVQNGRIIGTPVAGTHIHIVGPDLQPVRDGETGELIIGGAGVSRGYLGEPAQTEARFIADPFAGTPGARCYRTGDLGRRLDDGAIEFAGRNDDQIKLSGIRMEPAEIETHIEALPGVRRAAVVAMQRAPVELAAFVVADQDIDAPALRRHLQQRLPAAMVPKRFILVASLPFTASGKLDRRSLAFAPCPAAPGDTPAVPDVTGADEIERRLLAIWRHALARGDLGVDDEFFDQGGDSLASMHMLLAVEQEFGLRLDAGALDTLRTVAAMAGQLRAGVARTPPPTPASPTAWDETLRKQKGYVAAWAGHRHVPDGLIVTLNAAGKCRGLFWCFQGYPELSRLAAELGPEQPVDGMRSGHLVMHYTPDTIRALADLYASQVPAVQPEGPLQIGGNCQGGVIARALALALRASGRTVSRLFLMEQEVFRPYDEPVALIFGRDSEFNPYSRMADPDSEFSVAYRGGYTVDIIDGSHGQFFNPPNLGSLGRAIRRRLLTER